MERSNATGLVGMDAGGRYATRLRVAQETVAGGAENIGSHAVPGKRALRQSQRVGAVGGPAKRALGDITNNLSTNGPDRSVLNGKKATVRRLFPSRSGRIIRCSIEPTFSARPLLSLSIRREKKRMLQAFDLDGLFFATSPNRNQHSGTR